MKFNFQITPDNYKEMSALFAELGNPGSLRILLLLKGRGMSLMEVYMEIRKDGVFKHRESVYKALERLVELKIITKTYDLERKKILYEYPQN